MKLGIMQPYFFPGLGYFDLINITDRWIVFDVVQYRRHGWMNRNRILHPTQGWQYILAPLQKHARETAIKDILVPESDDWREKIVAQYAHYRKKAPHYGDVVDLLRESLDNSERRLARLNALALENVCKRLGVPFDHEVYSESDLHAGFVDDPGDWAFEISKALGAKTYVNPPGGRDLFDAAKFAAAGIDLVIRELPVFEYSQDGRPFEAELSILDVMSWNSCDTIKRFLDEHRS
jgi:WbqC-like protein family